MLRFRFLLVAIVCFQIQLIALAHPPDGEGKHEHGSSGDQVTASPAPGLILPAVTGPKPWSDQPVLDDPDRFQIAIMTDRTGGHRPGVWMKAVESVNLLRPDFVVSVGDLIEGYTEDEERIQDEWKEFLGFIDKMEMKFFFVAGNHDLSNPVMHKIWRERFGPKWYSFDYKNVHFICLCSEDPNFRISDEQLKWLETDLAESADARWTLVFVHKPLWFISERYLSFGMKDTTNWKPVEKMLHERPHTVFAGHQHHYAQFDRNGAKYYQLATTGGASQLRGVHYGEFDHMMWLTMEADGPRLTNLLLDGIVPADAVTEESLKRFRKFISEARVDIAPILVDDQQHLSKGKIDIRLVNEFDSPVHISGRIEGLPLRGLTLDPATLDLSAKPGETKQLSVNVEFGEAVPFSDLAHTLFRAKIRTDGVKPLIAEQNIPVVIDRRFQCPPTAVAVKLDGRLDEWQPLEHANPEPPLLVGPAEQWQGPKDASVAFSVAHDERFLYVAAKVSDDRLLTDHDKLVLLLDGRPIAERLRKSELGPGCHSAEFLATNSDGTVTMRSINKKGVTCQATVRTHDDNYIVEAAFPIELITDWQGEDWHSFQLTLMALDVDDPEESPCGVAWRGTQQIRRSNVNYGHFVREK